MKLNNKLFVVLFFLFITLIFFCDILFQDKSVYLDDIWRVSYPIRAFVKTNLDKYHSFVKWCPYIHNGMPIDGEAQSAAIYYPPNWINYYFFSKYNNINFNLILHFFLSLIFCYMVARQLKIEIVTSLIFSITFTFSGVVITHHNNVALTSAFPYIPLSFYFVLKFVSLRQFKYIIFTGLTLGLQLLTGHPQLTYYLNLFLFCYLFIYYGVSKRLTFKRTVWIIAVLLIINIIAVLMNIIQLSSIYTFLKTAGNRSGNGDVYTFFSYLSLKYKYLILFIFPSILGSPSTNSYFGGGFYWEYIGYCSVFSVITFILFWFIKNKNKIHLNLALCSIIFLTIAVLISTQLNKYLIFIPFLKMFRAHSRMLYIISFCLSLSSVLFLDNLIKQNYLKNKVINILLIIILAFGLLVSFAGVFINLNKTKYQKTVDNYLDGKITSDNLLCKILKKKISPYEIRRHGKSYYYNKFKRYFNTVSKELIFQGTLITIISLLILFNNCFLNKISFIVLIIVLFDMFRFALPLVPSIDKKFFKEKPDTVKFLQKYFNSELDEYKIWSLNRGGMYAQIINKKDYSDQSGHYYIKNFMHMNSAAAWNIANFEGDISIKYQEQIKFKHYVRHNNEFGLLSYYGVKFLITGIPLKDKYYQLIYNKNKVYIYENNKAVPIFYSISEPKIYTTDNFDSTIKIMEKNIDKPESLLVVNTNNKVPQIKYDPRFKCSLKIINYKPDKIILKINNSSACYIVWINSYHPDWKCIGDNDIRIKLYKVNLTNTGFYLKQGIHRIVLSYK